MFWQIPGTTIGTNFATPYTCIYVDRVEQSCLEMQDLQWLLWLRYIGHIFFIWTNGKEKLKSFTFLTLAMSPLRRLSHLQIFFLIFFWNKFKTIVHPKATDCHQYLYYSSFHPEDTRCLVLLDYRNYGKYRSQIKSWFLKREYTGKNYIERFEEG